MLKSRDVCCPAVLFTPRYACSCSSAALHDDPPTPWFRRYRAEFLRLMQFGEHETVDHPVACESAAGSGRRCYNQS